MALLATTPHISTRRKKSMKSDILEIQVRQWQATKTKLAMVAAMAAAAFLPVPAFSQVTKVNMVMTNVQAVLVGVSITVLTIAILWVGYKMAFQHAKWSEVSNIVIGGILIGGAPGIAAWLVN
jgi:type IV secretion system protein VirB2